MSAISLKSITGITSITTPTGVDDQLTLHNNNTTERVKIDTAGNVHVNNHLAIAGVTTFTGNVTLAEKIIHDGDTDTYLQFTANTINLHAGGTTGLSVLDTSVRVPTKLGINGAAPQTPLDIIANGSGYAMAIRGRSSDNVGEIRFTSNNYGSLYGVLQSAPTYLNFQVGSTTNALRISSGGQFTFNHDAVGTAYNFNGPSADNNWGGYLKLHSNNGTTVRAEIRASTSGMMFGYGGSERLRITSSGDLSLRSTTQNAYLGLTANSTAINFTLGSTAGANPRMYLFGTGNGQSTAGDILMATGIGGIFQIRSARSIKFEVNSDNTTTEALHINSSGLVGIGTGNAGAPLHIQSDVAGLSIRRGGQYLQFDANFGNGGDQSISSSAGFRVQTGGIGNTYERVRITTGGQLLVGTTSANQNNKIHARLANGSIANNSTASVILAENSGNAWITIGSGASSYGGILFADSGSSDIGQVRYNHSSNALELLTNGGNSSNIRLLIKSDGIVGINNTAPEGKGIDVAHSRTNGYAATSDTRNLAHIIARNSSDAPGRFAAISFINGGGTQAEGSINLVQSGNYTGDLTFKLRTAVSSWQERLRIKSDGKIGINDTDPSYALNVIGDNTASNGIGMLKGIIGVQNDTTAYGSSPTAGISFQTKYRTGPDVPLDVAAIWGGKENTTNGDKDGYMGFATREEGGSGSQERMRITSSGQLAIGGTTNVGTLLHIENGSGDSYIRCRASINKAILFNNSDGTAHGFLGSGGTNGGAGADLSIQSNSGNVMFYANNGLRAKVTSDGFVSHNNTSGDGDDDIAVALENDYSSWAVIYKNDWIGTNGGWGTYWAGNSGAAYRRVSSDTNPNEHVMVGSGVKRFTFDLDNGNMYYDGAIAPSAYDYAEYFEWEDGNPSNEDRRGYSVFVNSNGKIEKATDSTNTSDIIGVISGTAAILGDAAVYDWQGKWKVDEWGTVMRETVKQVTWKDEDGKNHSYDEDKVPSGLTIPSDASYRQHTRRILNPDYDESKEYVPRDMRQEWDPVGLLGKVRVRDDSPKNPNWKFIKVVNGKKMWLIR